MSILLALAVVAPVIGAVVGALLPERALDAMRTAALVSAASWLALLLDGGLVSWSRLHSVPLVAAAGCGAALLAAAVDGATVDRSVWGGVALAATAVGLAAGRTATNGL